jgi:hypothetical protein
VELVAHCGGDPRGAFLNTLTMADVTTGWLECMPLVKKSASNVIGGINIARKLLPFDLKGLDTMEVANPLIMSFLITVRIIKLPLHELELIRKTTKR